ncbi:hypothetical protein [Diaphorobacter aerolatus]|uniref:DUF4234 domain-containing protein n=1 Tax=Diaphorobacter aerolatus TaxID=1288495 RepID=A0A7H0GGU0_9BURK|nr:hypothetical protein [Diaphorobacter aerolatus]QNP47506.1 hypothetical protein H9K75_14735 [Diaphorobacter aerolatus]
MTTPMNQPPFFPVSLRKLAVLSICTMGLYHLYWFHAHWRHVRVWNGGCDFSPARRTLLFLFFCYPLFRRVRTLEAKTDGGSPCRPDCSPWVTSR